MTKEEVLALIKDVESGKVEPLDVDPDYYEKEYLDGEELYIVHWVAEDVQVFYAEHEHINEKRQEMFKGEITSEEFTEYINSIYNEYADQFNYDEVVGYQVDGKEIEWL